MCSTPPSEGLPYATAPYRRKKILVALVSKSQASGDSGDTKYLETFYIPKSPGLLPVLDELGKDNVVGAQQGAGLDKRAAATDDGDYAVEKKGRPSGGRRFSEGMRDGSHVLVHDRGVVFPGPLLHMSAFGEARPVDPRVIVGPAHGAVTEAIHEIEWYHELAVDSWRDAEWGDKGGFFSATENKPKSFTHLPSRILVCILST